MISGLAIIGGILLAAAGNPRKRLFALGIGLMATYLVGYFAWHSSGHGGFLPVREPLYHGLHSVTAVFEHLRDYPIARASKIAEAALVVLLAVLYRSEG